MPQGTATPSLARNKTARKILLCVVAVLVVARVSYKAYKDFGGPSSGFHPSPVTHSYAVVGDDEKPVAFKLPVEGNNKVSQGWFDPVAMSDSGKRGWKCTWSGPADAWVHPEGSEKKPITADIGVGVSKLRFSAPNPGEVVITCRPPGTKPIVGGI